MSDIMSSSVTATTSGSGMTSSKNRFFSLSRRFRFRVQSPDKGATQPAATVHFLDEDIDLETKERTTRKSDQHGNRPSKGILKTLRHRSPFRFRSKDAIIPEQEPSPPPPSQPTPMSTSQIASVPLPTPNTSKESKKKASASAPTPTSTQTKNRGRLVELKKPIPKSSSSNGTSSKGLDTTPSTESTGSTLMRRTSGLKDLIHKFDVTSDKNSKSKRVATDAKTLNVSATESKEDEQVLQITHYTDSSSDDQQQQQQTATLPSLNKSKTIDIPDLLRNVEKDPTTAATKAIFRHSNSSRQTASFDSTASMVSASESIITTNSSTRKPTSTARPLMISVVSSIINMISFYLKIYFFRTKMNHNIIIQDTFSFSICLNCNYHIHISSFSILDINDEIY